MNVILHVYNYPEIFSIRKRKKLPRENVDRMIITSLFISSTIAPSDNISKYFSDFCLTMSLLGPFNNFSIKEFIVNDIISSKQLFNQVLNVYYLLSYCT